MTDSVWTWPSSAGSVVLWILGAFLLGILFCLGWQFGLKIWAVF